MLLCFVSEMHWSELSLNRGERERQKELDAEKEDRGAIDDDACHLANKGAGVIRCKKRT